MRLVIAPHIDDDVLGCASVLGPGTDVEYCAIDETHIPGRPTVGERYAEASAAAAIGGYDWWELGGHTRRKVNHKVNHCNVADLIPAIERQINVWKPAEVYIPWPSYNQDHQAVFRAALVALRPHDVNHFVPRVFAYEQIHVAQWDVYPERRFQPTYYRPLDIEKKLAMYAAMASQVRSFRSPDMIRAHAALRGAACGKEYAEAFEVLRWVE